MYYAIFDVQETMSGYSEGGGPNKMVNLMTHRTLEHSDATINIGESSSCTWLIDNYVSNLARL